MINKKIVLIGCGNVGTSFIFACLQNNIGNNITLIDINENLALGNVLDLIDSTSLLLQINNIKLKTGTYKDCSDADIIVIAIGRNFKPGETRLDMFRDNKTIIDTIAKKIKNSGFKGVTVIATNPVDLITYAYWNITKFNRQKIIGTGTILDTARYKVFLSNEFNVSINDVNMLVIGEHGDSSVPLYSTGTIGNVSIDQLFKNNILLKKDIVRLQKLISKHAFEIIEKKKITNFGIATGLARIVYHILNDTNKIETVSICLKGEYNTNDISISVPVKIGLNGWTEIVKIELNENEKIKFKESVELLKKHYSSVFKK